MTTVEAPVSAEDSPRSSLVTGRLLLLLLVGGVVLLGLVFPFPLGGRFWSQLFDLAHAPVFCALLLMVAGFIDPGSIGLSDRWGVLRPVKAGEMMVLAGCCLLLGCVGEFLQAFAGRSPSVKDLLLNSAGVGAAVLWMCSRRVLHRRSLIALAAVLVLVVAMSGPVLGIMGAIQQQADFPLLASFERSADLSAWAEERSSMQRTTEWASDAQYSLKVNLFPGSFSGVNMVWPVSNWTTYDTLRWDIYNASTSEVTLTLKIHDRQHRLGGYDPADRFETMIAIPPEQVYTVTIDLKEVAEAPAARRMDMDQIAGVELFATDLKTGRTVLLDNMRLENPFPGHKPPATAAESTPYQ